LAVVAPLIVIFWMTESFVHVVLFDADFWGQVFHPAPHELWMRGLMTLVMLLLALAGSALSRERARRIEQLESYQQRLRELTARLAYADGDERRDLASRLHEGVSQQLAAARVYLGSVEATDGEGREALDRAGTILESSLAECRELAGEIAPPGLEHYGLGAALEALSARVRRRTGARVEITGAESAFPLAADVQRVAFQVIAEIIESAVADRTVRALALEFRREDGALAVGFHWDARGLTDYFSVQERIGAVGGRLCLEPSGPDSRLTLRVPLPAA
jgi:signal transduction histidine kinase